MGNVADLYGSNKLSILLSIPFIIREEGDELLTTQACTSSFEGLEVIFPEFSPCSISAVSL
ncbi:hypothetical protein L211DRAFT_260259 [Terfezia boudieri ATCC MYA-4762]|uniref:Uncharacterized protein n=1 Tax=Terfezia boudieri ATCC MYA-4762 TaxID=1051890 RepID=A0A3N4MM87_9PEZI|nr:hypothetical protein L211DRAFT_260259 [Terfezia boudieri ATCC MYA-4762]